MSGLSGPGTPVVTQDSRGRYASGGTYIPYTVEGGTPDAQDGYESVEWLARQPYCNGKVGTFGGSYNAWMQWMLAKLRPPHLVAMCAWSIPLENTEVDWWGSFRPGRRVKWWMGTIAPDIRRREGGPGPHHRGRSRGDPGRTWSICGGCISCRGWTFPAICPMQWRVTPRTGCGIPTADAGSSTKRTAKWRSRTWISAGGTTIAGAPWRTWA